VQENSLTAEGENDAAAAGHTSNECSGKMKQC
jgi:hypothetical protein